MSDTNKKAQSYRLEDVVLYSNTGQPHNINGLVLELSVYESITRSVMQGELVIDDGVGLIENVPIVGQERVMFALRTSSDHENIDFRTFHGVITEITNRDGSGANNQTYVLHFNTLEDIRNIRSRVTKSYKGTASEVALQIFTDTEGLNCKKKIEIEKSVGINNWVFPNIRPLSAIKSLANQAINESGSSAFMFWETHKGFNFRSIDNLFQNQAKLPREPKKIFISGPPVGQATGPEMFNDLDTLLNFEVKQSHNTYHNMSSGMFSSKLIKHDIFNKNFREYEYHYHDEFERIPHSMSGSTKKPGPMITKFKMDEDGKGISDYTDTKIFLQSVGSKKLYTDGVSDNQIEKTFQKSLSRRLEQDFFLVQFIVYGDSDLCAGDIIEARIPSSFPIKDKVPTSKTMERFLSGRYLIKMVRHKLNPRDQIYMTIMDCVKDSVYPSLQETEMTWASEPRREPIWT